jgi:hypothetical protein
VKIPGAGNLKIPMDTKAEVKVKVKVKVKVEVKVEFTP